MTYQELLDNARGKILRCKVCPVCDGVACGNMMPGPGSKAPGTGAHDNWLAWKKIHPNLNTFVADGEVDTSFSIFGHECKIPMMTGPIGTMLQYSKEDITIDYNAAVIEASKRAGFIHCFGDGLNPEVNPAAAASLEKIGGAAFPMFNPQPNDDLLEKYEVFKDSKVAAIGIVVDNACIRHMKIIGKNAGSKTVEEIREFKERINKPLMLKGIMNAKMAESALKAGADAIVVSNHGGRLLADVPATADVLPEVVDAVGGEIPVLVDSGIRSGVDIFKALALGANAVMICRPIPVAYFGGGAEGIEFYVNKLRSELEDAMYICGARKLSDITRDMVRIDK